MMSPIKKGRVSDRVIKMIHNLVMSENFSWFWNPNQVNYKDGANYAGFTHVFYKWKINSEYFPQAHELVRAIIKAEKLNVTELVRIQANLLPKIRYTEAELDNSVHVDMDNAGYKSIVYYVEDSDGETIIYGDAETRVKPIKGTYVMFDSHCKHRAGVPVKHKRRVVFNIILGVK